jgi:hypothetical protein
MEPMPSGAVVDWEYLRSTGSLGASLDMGWFARNAGDASGRRKSTGAIVGRRAGPNRPDS